MPDPTERDLEVGEPDPGVGIATQPADTIRAISVNPPTSNTTASNSTQPLGNATETMQRIGGGCFSGGDDIHEEEERGARGTGKPILIEFRDFVLGGNLIRMAVAFVLALSLNNLVSQFVASFVTPVLGIIGASDFQDLKFTIRGSVFAYGEFFNAAIAFMVICSVLFFCLILPVQRYGGRCVPSWIIRKCPYCCTDMPAIATKCANCTSEIIPLVKPLKTPNKKNT